MNISSPASAAIPTPAAEEHGVLIAGTRVPLTLISCALTATVVGDTAKVRVDVVYTNEGNKDVPVVAALPMPTGWVIVRCEVTYDGVEMRSRFVPTSERGEASVEGASHKGSTRQTVVPTTLTNVGTVALPFTVVVGTSITVSTTYLAPLSPTAASPLTGRFVFSLPADLIPTVRRPPPTTAAYNSVYTLINQPETEASLRLHVHACLPCPLRGEVHLDTASPVNQLQMQPLECHIDYHGDSEFELTCTLPLPEASGVGGQYRGGPLCISCDVQDTVEPLRIFVDSTAEGEEDGGCTAVAATLTSTGLAEKVNGVVNSEFVFVVDSHHASTSEAVGRALSLAIRALPASVRVNVVVLKDEGYLTVYPAGSLSAQKVELESLGALITELNPQKPSTNGVSQLLSTLELLLPLHNRSTELFALPQGYVRHLVILSDDAAVSAGTAPATVAALGHRVREACKEARVSAVAVTAANASVGQHTAAGLALLETLSRHGSGYFVEAASPAATSAALVSVLAAAAVPTLTDLRIAFIGNEGAALRPALAANMPSPVVPSGFAHTVYALAPAHTASLSVHATGKVGSQVVEFMGMSNEASVCSPSPSEPAEGARQSPLLLAAANARVRALLADGTPSSDALAEILQLSQSIGVPSPFTRLVMRCDNPNGGDAEDEPLSVNPAASFATTAAAADGTRFLVQLELLQRKWVAALSSRLVSPSSTAARLAEAPPVPTAAMQATLESFVRAILAQAVVSPVLAEPSVEHLIELQERDGGFLLNAAFASAVGIGLDSLEATEPVSQILSPKKQMNKQKKSVWATVVAICFLEAQAQPVSALALRAAVANVRQRCSPQEWELWRAEAQDLLGKKIDI